MNIKEASEKFLAACSYVPSPLDEKNARQIGILNVDNEAIAFVADCDFIFANKLVIASTCNDDWSSMNAFNTAMKLAYGDKFISSI